MPGLTELLHLYDQRNRSRSRGGLHTISGMAFQIYCYLADYAAILADRRPDAHEPASQPTGQDEPDSDRPARDLANFECLSDYLLVKRGKSPVDYTSDTVVCVQAKRTLNRKTLSKAAEDFVAIDQFLEREEPGLRSRVRFEVVASRGKPAGSDPWQGITPPQEVSPQDLARFETMRNEHRLLPPRIVPDPWWRLIATIYHCLSDPFRFAYKATTLCLQRGLTPEGARRLQEEIADLFAGHRRNGSRLSGKVLRPADFAPDQRQSNLVNLGQIPSLADLRDGRFMERGEHLEGALKALDEVLQDRATDRDPEREARRDPQRATTGDPAVHALWLGGASGSGKSVLLLHLMRELVVEREAHVIWLDERSEDFLPLLEALQSSDPPREVPRIQRDSEPIYVFVDDFYAPLKRRHLNLQKVGSLVRHSGETNWPTLVTCGPTDQKLTLDYREGDCGINFTLWKLPLATPEERGRIRTWVAARTGRNLGEDAASADGPDLVVSIVYEEVHGDLRDIAHRFKARLEDADLDAAVLPVLALNRLYLDAPVACLSEKDLDALDRINKDGEFLLLPAPGQNQRLRLTHPHLSDEFYQFMRARDGDRVRVRDLVTGFKVALVEDPEVAVSVLELIVEVYVDARDYPWEDTRGCLRLGLLPKDELALELAKTWHGDAQASERLGLTERAWAWTLWAQISRSNAGVASRLSDASGLAAAALAEVTYPSDYWWPAWFRLLSTGDIDEGVLLRLAFERLGKEVDSDDDWYGSWRALLKRTPTLAKVGISIADLLRQALDWLKGHEDSYYWHDVWRDLLAHPDLVKAHLSANLLRQGHEWLKGHEDSMHWHYIWRKLLGHPDLAKADLPVADLLRQGHEWLKGHEDSMHWHYVWRKLRGHPDLAKADLPVADLLRQGHEWLKKHEHSDYWIAIWQDLRRHPDLAEAGLSVGDLLRQGHEWLKGYEDSDCWHEVWRDLLNHHDLAKADLSVADLLRQGHEWLKGHEDSDSWDDVWRDLLNHHDLAKADLSVADLLRCGHEWLEGHEESVYWIAVWRDLLGHPGLAKADLSVADLLRQGHEWLKGHEDSDSWDDVWRVLLSRDDLAETDLSVPDLLRQGHAWFESHRDRAPAGLVLIGLLHYQTELPANTSLPDLLHLGLQWLARDWAREDPIRDYPPTWRYLWLALLPHVSSGPASRAFLISAARRWLIHRDSQGDPQRPAVEAALATLSETASATEPPTAP